jgi:site-specific DNA recombinase
MTKPVRCAIYTRKSSEEGLDQEFNSLDAQYEACAAYITSQRHEGWTPVRHRYDDGGFSGGNLERPALKRLLADVAAGKVDVIVLYKVDRLTRSLADFSKIVDVLDKANASFVSVTQSFNTTTSMGRLMLNVLLSFAQFEREVTGERIRDKIAASKKKGMWMGGVVPIGYVVKDRKLIIDDEAAETVRHIFRRYLALGSGSALLAELREQGLRTRLRAGGIGGNPFTRGMLFNLLGNPIYRGNIKHRDAVHPGEHQPIVDETLWDAVQARIAENQNNHKGRRRAREPSLLLGILRDGLDRRMTPSHATKGKVRYRYYVTHQDAVRSGAPAPWRLPAKDLETAVIDRLRKFFADPVSIRRVLGAQADNGATFATAIDLAAKVVDRFETYCGRSSIAGKLLIRVIVHEDSVRLQLSTAAIGRLLGCELADATIALDAPTVRVRHGKDVKLVLSTSSGEATKADSKLIALLQEAMGARAAMIDHPERTLRDAAAASDKCRRRFAQLLQLSFLAPEIVRRITQGRHPADLTPRDLLAAELPLCWKEQQAMFGIA